MGIASEQDIPIKPKEKTPSWSFNTFSFLRGITTSLVKSFNPMEGLLFLTILITGVGVIIDKEFHWLWYIIILILIIVAYSLRKDLKIEDKK